MLVSMLVLIVAIGVVNNKLNNEQELSASAGYTDYEMDQMNLHDGDVLVDSLNVTSVPGTSSGSGVDANTDPSAEGQSSGAAIDSSMIVLSDDVSELANADAYFEEARATINMDRNQVISMLTDVIEETKDGSAEKNNATQQKLKIINYMNTEKVVENLIRNKGFTDALVLMTDNSVNVTVNKQEITQSDVAKICDIVMRETGREAGQIVIQSKY
jgi:stage III sporulation protein AH